MPRLAAALAVVTFAACSSTPTPHVVVPPPVELAAPPPSPMATFERAGFALAGAEYWPYHEARELAYPDDVLWGFYPEAGVAPPDEDEANPDSATPAAVACAERAYAALWQFLAAPPAALQDIVGRGASDGFTARFYLWTNDYSRAADPYPPGRREARLWYWKRTTPDPERPPGYWKWESTLTQDGTCMVPQPAQIEAELASIQADLDARATVVPAPGLRLPRDLAVSAYHPTLRIDPAQPTYTGSIAIEGALVGQVETLWLHARGLRLSRPRVERPGGEVIALRVLASDVPDLVALRADAPLPPGPVTIHLDLAGELEENDTRGLFRQRVGDDWYAYTQFEAISARRALPLVDEPDRKVPWHLVLEVPDGQVAVGNAPIASEVAAAGTPGWRRITFVPTEPLPSYLLAFAVGPFEVVDAGRSGGGAPLRVLTLRDRAADGAFAAATIPKILADLEAWFGTPYPFTKLDALAIPTTINFGAMENAGLVTYGERILLLPPDAPATRLRRLAGYAAHELAHMWFGDLVTPAWWDDLWLNESFATWLPPKVLPPRFPSWFGPDAAVADRGGALLVDALATARQIRQPIVTADDIGDAFDGITYDKGAAVLRMFERWIGAEAMQRGVRAYLRRHAYGTATAADFLAAVSEASGRDVGTPMSTFLDQPGAPRIDAAATCDGGVAQVALRQRRYLPLGAAATTAPSRWQVPVCVAYGRGRTRGEICTLLVDEAATVSVPGAGCVDWIYPNAGGAGYYRSGLGAAWGTVLAKAWPRLDAGERLAVVQDLGAAVAAGELEVGAWLDALPALVASGTEDALEEVATAIGDVRAWLPTTPGVERWIGKTLGPIARKLGWQTRKRAAPGDDRIRAAIVPLVAELGGDRALRREAVALAQRPGELADGVRAALLGVAIGVEPALFEPLLAAWHAATAPRLRDDLIAALGSVHDGARLAQALALTLDPALDIRDTIGVVDAALADLVNQPAAEAFVLANLPALRARLPEGLRSDLAGYLATSCDLALEADRRAFAATALGKVPGAKRAIAQAFEGLRQCAAWRAQVEPGLAAWAAARR
ncbi:MAG: M1 family metallopeptidase [Kofleriaceae bacterium]